MTNITDTASPPEGQISCDERMPPEGVYVRAWFYDHEVEAKLEGGFWVNRQGAYIKSIPESWRPIG